MCLPNCPTYALTGLEIDSPRGRIRLMKAVADGELDLTENFKETMNFCLNCQACVTACPAGVEYGHMVEATHLHIAAHDKELGKASRLKEFILNWVFARLSRLKKIGTAIRIYQKSGLEWFVQASGIFKLLSKKLHDLTFMVPSVRKKAKYQIPTSSEEKVKARVGVLIGCVQDVFFPDVNQDTIDVLRINGYDIYIPGQNFCCGSVHGHNGNLEMARFLAKQTIDGFLSGKVDWVIVNSAGCGAYMKEYASLLKDDAEYAGKAGEFSKKVKDISEFLVEQGWRKPGPLDDMIITYHEPCHLVHSQKVSIQPRDLIQSIPRIEFRELPEANWCCGSAGIYNIVRYEDAIQILERKMQNIRSTGVSHVVTGNPGCMIQLLFGTRKFMTDVQIIHPVSLLRKAYEKEGVI
jgi:glycolate oxidase iron-sulfur subunit